MGRGWGVGSSSHSWSERCRHARTTRILQAGGGSSRPFCALEHRRGGAMIAVNVSQLLRGPVEGSLKLTRTNHGILADFAYTVPIEQECGRCLDPARTTIESQFSEEFL